MADERGWRVLKTKNTQSPILLVKSSLTSSGFTIQLTDLRRVWAEQLTKAQVVSRAVDNGCSIDPSGDDSQYRKLQEKVQSAIDNEGNTTAVLSLPPDGNDSLLLSLLAPLPSPLPTLKWDVHLHALPFDQVGSLLISPLIHYASSLQHQVQSLVTELHEKDRVISKIADRLESSGNDLTTVFPGTSNIKISRKKPQRDQLARHINGLAEFDEDHWKSKIDSEQTTVDISEHTLNRIFNDLPDISAESVSSSAVNGWWRNLTNEASENGQSVAPTANGSVPSQTLIQEEDEDETMIDDEFQRQATPPALRRDGPATNNVQTEPQIGGTDDDHSALPEDESTADEESDLDAPTQLPRRPKGKTADVSSLSPENSSGPRNRVEVTANASNETDGGSSAPVSSVEDAIQQNRPTEKPRPKLGKLGGKLKQSATIESSSIPSPTKKLSTFGSKKEPSVPSETTEPELATSSKRRLGALGGKSKSSAPVAKAALDETHKNEADYTQGEVKRADATTDTRSVSRVEVDKSPDNDSSSRSRPLKKEESPAPRETSKERADRKRDELKRGLEEKSKAPVKKKRKF